MTDPTGTPYDPGTAQTEAESTQGMSKPHDRPVQLSWLHEAVDILLNTWLGYEEEISGVARQMHEADDKYFGTVVYRQIKALMVAGWSAPQERTLGVPNGLVLTETQWRHLEDFEDVTVTLPGGQHVLTIRTAALHPRSHFQPGSPLHDELWAERARAAIEASGQAWGRGYGESVSNDETHDWKVPVPRSFLANLVAFAYALREAGDFAAANSLDNLLASIRGELRTAGIDHADHGKDALPAMNDRTRTKHLLHALVYDPQLYRDVRTVLEYVSAGRDYLNTFSGRYPDGRARRALGRLDDVERATGAPPLLTPEAVRRAGEGLTGKTFTVNVPRENVTTQWDNVKRFIDTYVKTHEEPTAGAHHVPHPATAEEDLRHQLGQRTDDCAKVREHLLPILQAHEQTKDDVASPQPDTLRAGYVAKVAAGLLTWYADEVERLRQDGLSTARDASFINRAEHSKISLLEQEVENLKGALESTRRGLVAMETQRDDLRTAIITAAGFDPDKINPIDVDYVKLVNLLDRNEQIYDSEYDACLVPAETKPEDQS